MLVDGAENSSYDDHFVARTASIGKKQMCWVDAGLLCGVVWTGAVAFEEVSIHYKQ